MGCKIKLILQLESEQLDFSVAKIVWLTYYSGAYLSPLVLFGVDAGKPVSHERSLIAEDLNSVGTLIEDMSSAKQAGLYTNSAAAKRTVSYRRSDSLTLTVILILLSDTWLATT